MIQPPLKLTQGDNAIFFLTAVDGDGNPIDLTGATFQTFIDAPNGQGVITIPNSQHIANPDQINYTGQFSVEITQSDSESFGLGNHKEILTQVTIGSNQVFFRGFNSLQVYAPTPFS